MGLESGLIELMKTNQLNLNPRQCRLLLDSFVDLKLKYKSELIKTHDDSLKDKIKTLKILFEEVNKLYWKLL